MKKINRYQLAMLAALVLAVKLVSVWTYAPAATSTLAVALQATATPAPTAAPQPTVAPPVNAGDVIPIQPLTDVTSLSATVQLTADGLMNNRRAQGGLTAVVNTNDQGQSHIAVTGSMLGDIVAQVGGAAVSLFSPRQVDVYKVPEGTYVVVQGLFPVCIKPNAPRATEALDKMGPQEMMALLTAGDAARGTLVGDETVNGMPARHYTINGEWFLQAARSNPDENVRTFGEALWSADDADLFISTESGIPVAFRGSYSGGFEPLQFQGDFDVQIDVTGINTNPTIQLPSACNNPISP
jgi:hypothetical protein